MTIDLKPLLSPSQNRLLFSVELQPIQTKRFQPTGFPDLGAAVYQAGDTTCLLVESAQSMANRLEETCWDKANERLVDCLGGLSYVRVEQNGEYLTSTLTEAHRLASAYILPNKLAKDEAGFPKQLAAELSVEETGPIDRKLLALTLFKYDLFSLVHGVFLSRDYLAGGRLRIARAVSSFVEAEGAQPALSGGVKNDHINPKGESKAQFGNAIFTREEFTAERIAAHFNVDLGQIRGYGLGENETSLLILLSLFKIRALLDGDLRFRTACDLQVVGNTIEATNPAGYKLPSLSELEKALPNAIANCKAAFGGKAGVTTVTYATGKSK